MPDTDFQELLADLDAVQRRREATPVASPRFAKAMAPARARPALNLVAMTDASAALARRNGDLARDVASTRVRFVLTKALAANAEGRLTATQVARLEAAGHRIMAALSR
ncbi:MULTISPECIES: hypothetical protein [Roseomonadaceae]|uniref:Uncharacterized protein n=1 Tax=Falsiroseomonas oleicola TaxID=2801474 RepID=A0ABS6HAN2_9PROT|nr:hypothetical protein [Roseomonas oleicola]MBU8545782.1 hypothetical protein [Roseomonas oleicola]